MTKNIKDWLDDPRARAVDLLNALRVEIVRDQHGKLWVNVDGVCALRIRQVDMLDVDDLLKIKGK